MDYKDAITVVYEKIAKMEPRFARIITGSIMVQKNGEKEIVRLAFASDVVIQTYITEFYKQLYRNTPAPIHSNPPIPHPFHISPTSTRTTFPSSPTADQFENHMSTADQFENHMSLLMSSIDDDVEGDNYYSNPTSERQFGRVKTCHYYNRGYCRHGNDCRYYHDDSERYNREDNQLYNSTGFPNLLEWEITEILKSRRGSPVSIASLPMIYYESYGKHLQANGYLTESQRHGKAGYSLTKLLARLSNIRLIDRPHGQHAIVLAEDVPRYMGYGVGRNDPGPIVYGSRQLYLTFPAESTFTEEDVANYFNKYGKVEDVRIPSQEKRMYGYVCFDSAETVNTILSIRIPHFIGGARVLVKPYREKSKFVDRKYSESLTNFSSNYANVEESELNSSILAASTQLRNHLHQNQNHILELERCRQRLLERQIVQSSQSNFSYFNNYADSQRIANEPYRYSSYGVNNALNNESTNDNQNSTTATASNITNQESDEGININLTESR